MTPLKTLKTILISGWILGGLLWMASSTFSQPSSPDNGNAALSTLQHKAEDFVGSETCQTCHEDQFNKFAKTPHAKYAHATNLKGKMQGCESCHGPGKQHVDAGGDKSLIRTFENEGPKQISETCLTCHAGKEEHNNYRRGEHWRNDVGCIDCHSSHSADSPVTKAESISLVSESSNLASLKMLRSSEPQLCLKCHNEMKAQFTQPFHHKVLEGTMKCSDCHNPHGGFESKQARLATGADAACVKCHTDKQGPFVYEHAPLKVEGCASCHTPHGSSNAKLLKRNSVSQLCLECHTNAHEIGAPSTPSFHNLATARFQNCTTCHAKIHGSQTHPFFFR